MNTSADIDIGKILNAFYRRRGLIIAVFAIVFLLTTDVAFVLPRAYRSSSLILVTPQRLPASYVTSTVTSSIQDRIQSITQQILSRTSLEKIIKDFNLYPDTRQWTTMEDRIDELRRKVRADVQRDKSAQGPPIREKSGQTSTTFLLSFQAESPAKAVQVTNRLASLFIEENLKDREERAIGTTSFINAEVERIRKELEEQETVVNEYKAKYRYELPDQLSPNLKTLDHLRDELQNNTVRLGALQERTAAQEKQLAEMDTAGAESGGGVDAEGKPTASRPKQIETKKSQLASLLAQYSERHPDVIKLRKEIDALEKETPTEEPTAGAPAPRAAAASRNPLRDTIRKQMTDTLLDIRTIKAKNEISRKDITTYQTRVENTPLRAIELSKVGRNYEITLKKYQDLVAKALDSQLSENMEKKQKGEQFQVLDPANVPEKPESPKRSWILLLGLVGGLGAGFGLAFLLEIMDTSFKAGDELEGYANVPLLATLPAVVTRGTVLQKRRMQGLLVLASVILIVVGVVTIHLSVPYFVS